MTEDDGEEIKEVAQQLLGSRAAVSSEPNLIFTSKEEQITALEVIVSGKRSCLFIPQRFKLLFVLFFVRYELLKMKK